MCTVFDLVYSSLFLHLTRMWGMSWQVYNHVSCTWICIMAEMQQGF